MADSRTTKQNYQDIANAIRSVNGEEETYTPAEMAGKISTLSTGGRLDSDYFTKKKTDDDDYPKWILTLENTVISKQKVQTLALKDFNLTYSDGSVFSGGSFHTITCPQLSDFNSFEDAINGKRFLCRMTLTNLYNDPKLKNYISVFLLKDIFFQSFSTLPSSAAEFHTLSHSNGGISYTDTDGYDSDKSLDITIQGKINSIFPYGERMNSSVTLGTDGSGATVGYAGESYTSDIGISLVNSKTSSGMTSFINIILASYSKDTVLLVLNPSEYDFTINKISFTIYFDMFSLIPATIS